MKKTFYYILTIVILLLIIFFVYYFFIRSKNITNNSKYLSDKTYCEKDSDCIEGCGESVNKYFNEKYPLAADIACPQVMIYGNKCDNNKCTAIFDQSNPQ